MCIPDFSNHSIKEPTDLAVQMLSTVPTLDFVLLEPGESNKGKDIGSHYMQLVCRHVLPLGKGSM